MSQFNVYDIFGYLLPGAVVVVVCLAAFSQYVPISLQPTLGESAVLIVVCYIVGHFLRASIADKIKAVRPSEDILSAGNRTFTEEIKSQIGDGLVSIFSAPSSRSYSLTNDQQQYFNLAYALIVQKNAAGYTPIYNSLYALYRGLLAASGLSSVIVIVSFSFSLCSGPDFQRVILHLLSFVVLGYLTWGVPFRNKKSPLRTQFDKYSELFAASVYRNFLVWYQTRDASSDPGSPTAV